MQRSFIVAVWACAGCAEGIVALDADDAGVDGGSRADATAGPDGGARAERDADGIDGGATAVCSRDRLTATWSHDGAREVSSEPWIALPARPDPARRRTEIFTDGPGGLWLATDRPLLDAVPTPARAVFARGTGRPLCGDATVTWDYGALRVRVSLDAVAALPACVDGAPVEGRVEACSDAHGQRCDGGFSSLVSSVPGYPLAEAGNTVFGGSAGGPFTFQLGSISGVGRPGPGGGGYALFEQGRTLFCVDSVTYSQGSARAPARLVLSGLRRVGACADAAIDRGATLEACVGP